MSTSTRLAWSWPRRGAGLALGIVLGWAAPARTQPPTLLDDTATRAVIVVATFDGLAAACDREGGFSSTQARTVSAWQSANGVPNLRVRLRGLDEPQQARVQQAAAAIIAAVSREGAGPCAAAVSLTRLPDAQIATRSPQLVAPNTLPDAPPSSVSAPTAPAVTGPAGAGASRDASTSASLLAEIDSFGFDTRLTMGVGGFLTTSIFPVVLFKNGDVLKNVDGLAFPGGLAAYRRAKPGDWTHWRRNGGRLELQTAKGWQALPLQATYAAMPPDFRLDGRYRNLSGLGTVAIGGGDAVTAWREYRFTRDGTVVRGGGAGARSEVGNGSVVTNSVAPNRRGRYRIDGLMLHITYDDGSMEQRILVTDPKKPTAIWIDGVGYVQ